MTALRRGLTLVVALLATLTALSCGVATADDGCDCVEAQRTNGWCRPCGVGYVAAVPMTSRILFETLDAHGHHIDPDVIECASCRKAIETDGFCEPCNWGFFKRQLYFSRLTHVIARGEQAPQPAAAAAATATAAAHADCRTHEGWCDRCGHGTVGNVLYRDARDYTIARREYVKLRAAVDASARCELCAVALFTGATCPLEQPAD